MLVFAEHRCLLDACLGAFHKRKVGCIRIDGETPTDSRQALVRQFQEDPGCRAAVLGIRAAGVGLTLTARAAPTAPAACPRLSAQSRQRRQCFFPCSHRSPPTPRSPSRPGGVAGGVRGAELDPRDGDPGGGPRPPHRAAAVRPGAQRGRRAARRPPSPAIAAARSAAHRSPGACVFPLRVSGRWRSCTRRASWTTSSGTPSTRSSRASGRC